MAKRQKPGAGSVRVVAGRWRGRRITTAPGMDTRPTADRVREALFSILGSQVPGACVVDAFAGTGALGIEALSRGAAQAVFLEKSAGAAALIRKNLESLDAGSQAVVLRADALDSKTWHSVNEQVDLILADPPYGNGSAERFLSVLPRGYPAGRGLLVIEHFRDASLQPPAHMDYLETRAYGSTALSFYRGKP